MKFLNKNWMLLIGILILAVLVLLIWSTFSTPIKLLVSGLALVLAVAAAYWLLLTSIKLDESLKESHFEKFRRLDGLYRTIPEAIRTQPENLAAVKEFESQRSLLESCIDENTSRFTRDDAPDLVHNLQLAYLQLATVDFLRFNIQSVETEYRQAVGPTAYDAYLAAIMRTTTGPSLTPDARDRLLRSEATYLVNETRRQQLLRQHVQSTREKLLTAAFRSWWANIIPLLAILLAFFVCLSWVKTAKETPTKETDVWTVDITRQYFLSADPGSHGTFQYTPLFKAFIIGAVLALSGIAGATGGMMSVIQRVQTGTPENDPSTDLFALSQAETAVFFAPVTGLIFAFVLSLFFAGGVLSGSVFPTPFQGGAEWFLVLFNAKSLAVWLLWAFLAGFCERLVPDALDTLAKQQSDNTKTSPAGARNAPQNQILPEGTDKDGHENSPPKIPISGPKAASGTSGTVAAPTSSNVPMSTLSKVDITAGNIR